MQINVDIDPEAVNRQVAEAIINSALGATLKQEIEKQVGEALKGGWSHQSIVARVVQEEIRQQVQMLVAAPDNRERIRVLVEHYLAEKLTGELITEALDRVWNKLFER